MIYKESPHWAVVITFMSHMFNKVAEPGYVEVDDTERNMGEKEEEMAVRAETDTIIEPRTVVIHSQHAHTTDLTMMRSKWTRSLTPRTHCAWNVCRKWSDRINYAW